MEYGKSKSMEKETTNLLYETNAMLREMRVDVSYIKTNMTELKETVKTHGEELEDQRTFKAKVIMIWGFIVFILTSVAHKVIASL